MQFDMPVLTQLPFEGMKEGKHTSHVSEFLQIEQLPMQGWQTPFLSAKKPESHILQVVGVPH